MSTLPKNYVTPEQYLEIDRQAERKSEYYGGEMFEMPEASWAHNLIVVNTLSSLSTQVRGKPCAVLPSDMRLRIGTATRHAYPDAMVLCAQPEFVDQRQDIILNPTVIIEVLSRSTESYDRGRKFEYYSAIDSLREYVLIASDRISIQVLTRDDNGVWRLRQALESADTVALESIGCRLSAAEIYKRVTLPGPESRP